MVNRDATILDIVDVEQFDVAVDLHTIFILRNWLFVVESRTADTFVTFEVVRLHALAFLVNFSFELAR